MMTPETEDGQTAKDAVPNESLTSNKRLHSHFEYMVFVDVGAEQKRYAMHKGLLCSRSGYFKAALTGKFREAEDQVVTLDDEEPETFRMFNAWLYTDVLVEDSDPLAISWSSMFNIYIFAEKRIIPLLQNAAIDAIIRASKKENFPSEEIRHAWAMTGEKSSLRKLLVDLRLYEGEDYFNDQFRTHIDDYDIAFVAAVAMRAAELITLSLDREDSKPEAKEAITQWLRMIHDPWDLRCQRYHIHEALAVPCDASR